VPTQTKTNLKGVWPKIKLLSERYRNRIKISPSSNPKIFDFASSARGTFDVISIKTPLSSDLSFGKKRGVESFEN
jgi:hypothetical protein